MLCIILFAGYDGVPDFFQMLLKLIQESIKKKDKMIPQTFQPSNGTAYENTSASFPKSTGAATNGSRSTHHQGVQHSTETQTGSKLSSSNSVKQVNGIWHDIPVQSLAEKLLPPPASATN